MVVKISMNYKFILLIPLIEIYFYITWRFFWFFSVVFLIILTGAFGLILLRSNINLGEKKFSFRTK